MKMIIRKRYLFDEAKEQLSNTTVCDGSLIVVPASMEESSIKLTDGRILSYAVYGPVSGTPVLYFHGTPSSRLELLLLNNYELDIEEMLHQNNLKVIAVDRPGMGLSTFNKNGTFLSFADDARELLVSLNIKNCPVLCWSGGGPYALAIAHQHPEVIKQVYINCGFTTRFTKKVIGEMGMNKWYFRSAKYTPFLLRTALSIIKKRKVTSAVSQKLTGLPDEDHELLKDVKHLSGLMTNTVKEACRRGTEGAVHDARSYFNHFGFDIKNIHQPITYWWGTNDNTVTGIHATTIEKETVNGTVLRKTNEGHLSLYVNYMNQILQTVASSVGLKIEQ
jgi:pimeloyl-ACP methyl ester carboxylesterase